MKMNRTLRNAVVGFTLIELMVVIAIVGILAAVAIPQYQTYTVRTSATQALSAIRPFQLAVSEFAMINQTVPTTGNVTDLPGISGVTEADTCNGLIKTVTYSSAGTIDVIDPNTNQATGETETAAQLTATFYGDLDDNTATRADACGGDDITIPKQLSGRTLVFNGNMNANGGMFWDIAGNDGNGNGSTVAPKYWPNL